MKATPFTGLIYDHLLPHENSVAKAHPLRRFVQKTAMGANRTSRFTTTLGQVAELQGPGSESSRFD